eukprot:510721_1
MTCDTDSLTVSIIQAFMFLFGAIFIIWLSYRFTLHGIPKDTNRCTYYITICFCIMIILAFVMYVMENAAHCLNEDVGVILGYVGDGGWAIHYILFVWLLFFRLDYILQGSPFAISCISRLLFYVLFSLWICGNNAVFFIDLITQNDDPSLAKDITGAIGLLSMAVLAVWMIVLFIYKLIVVTKKTDDETLRFNMIRSFILAVVFAVCMVLVVIVLMSTIAITENSDTEYVSLIYNAATETNVTVNCCCILFGFDVFRTCYMNICGLCQTKCVNLCAEKRENESTISTV